MSEYNDGGLADRSNGNAGGGVNSGSSGSNGSLAGRTQNFGSAYAGTGGILSSLNGYVMPFGQPYTGVPLAALNPSQWNYTDNPVSGQIGQAHVVGWGGPGAGSAGGLMGMINARQRGGGSGGGWRGA